MSTTRHQAARLALLTAITILTLTLTGCIELFLGPGTTTGGTTNTTQDNPDALFDNSWDWWRDATLPYSDDPIWFS